MAMLPRGLSPNAQWSRPLARRKARRTTSTLSHRFDTLEPRQLLAVFTVTNTDDSGPGSLRAAIQSANATPAPDTIEFSIDSSGVQSIGLGSSLPAITRPLTIDGTTQDPESNTPVIELDGAEAGSNAFGLTVNSAQNVQIVGLTIRRFTGAGILLNNAPSAIVRGCFIGTNSAGTSASPNGEGIRIVDGGGFVIGGTDASDRNLISGNTSHGIVITGDVNGGSVSGNYIGADVSGNAALGNGGSGVRVFRAGEGIVIGDNDGSSPQGGNVISANGGGGIQITSTDGVVIFKNFIGTGIGTSVNLGNSGNGIYANRASDLRIGDQNGFQNVISWNSFNGILLNRAGSNAVIHNNVIGLVGEGEAGGNGRSGIALNR